MQHFWVLLTCQKGEGGSLHGCPVQQPRPHAAGPQPRQYPRGVGPVRGALPCNVGQEVDPTGPCRLLLCQLGDCLVIQPKGFAHLQACIDVNAFWSAEKLFLLMSNQRLLL